MEFGLFVLIDQVDIDPSVCETRNCLPSWCQLIDVIGYKRMNLNWRLVTFEIMMIH